LAHIHIQAGKAGPPIHSSGGKKMANCSEMKEGDLYICKTCGLELKVSKACSCGSASGHACSVPLQCCGQDMVKGGSK